MPLIQCLIGEAATVIGGATYHFQRDVHGRYVADVPVERHAMCLVSAGTYRQVDGVLELPPAPVVEQAAGDKRLSELDLLQAMAAAGSLSFERRDDDVYVVTAPWPETALIDNTLLADPPPFATRDEDGRLSFALSNGSATYAPTGATETVTLFTRTGSAEFTPAAPAVDHADLTLLKGVGDATAEKLKSRGFDTLDKLAALDEGTIRMLDADLQLNGLFARARLVEQAQSLIAPPPKAT